MDQQQHEMEVGLMELKMRREYAEKHEFDNVPLTAQCPACYTKNNEIICLKKKLEAVTAWARAIGNGPQHKIAERFCEILEDL